MVAIRGRGVAGDIVQNMEIRGSNSNALTTVAKDNMVMVIYEKENISDVG